MQKDCDGLMYPGRTRSVVVLLFLPVFILINCGRLLAELKSATDVDLERINGILNDLRTQLQIPQRVHATIVPTNERMVSVERVSDGGSNDVGYVICFDANFLSGLDEEELRAAIAHELGHVWIYSHHPYLHTEALANEVAMRVVSRESLRKVYSKLWTHLGASGDMDTLLGVEREPDAVSLGGTK